MSLSDTEVAIIERAVQEALQHLEKNAPEECSKMNIDLEKKKAVTEAARNAATEQVKLAKEFADRPDDIAGGLAKHLPESRIIMLRKALEFPTFQMDITKKDDGKHWVELMSEQHALEPARALKSFVDIDWAEIKQYASIVVESVALVMSVVGLSIPTDGSVTKKAIQTAVEAIQLSSKLQKALKEFTGAWNKAEGKYGKAEAIFTLIKEIFAHGILWNIIKLLFANMTWYDWLLTAVRVIAMITAAVATGGTALIAKIALIVLDAVKFARKIYNMGMLGGIKEASAQEQIEEQDDRS